jgi:hypothetical protein
MPVSRQVNLLDHKIGWQLPKKKIFLYKNCLFYFRNMMVFSLKQVPSLEFILKKAWKPWPGKY